MILPDGPGKLGEVVRLEDELLQLPQPPDLVGDRVQLVLLQVEDPELLQLTNVRREPSQKVVREYQNLKLVSIVIKHPNLVAITEVLDKTFNFGNVKVLPKLIVKG